MQNGELEHAGDGKSSARKEGWLEFPYFCLKELNM
jgi:hypothetical protein